MRNRDYEASTSIFEPALIGEYYFIKNKAENSYLFNKGRGKGLIRFIKSLDFYAFTGIGGLSYSIEPNDKLAESWTWITEDLLLLFLWDWEEPCLIIPQLNFGLELGLQIFIF